MVSAHGETVQSVLPKTLRLAALAKQRGER